MLKPFLTKWPFLFKFRLFLGAVLLVLIGIFLYLKIVPFGQITYSRSWPRGFASGKGFIYDFKPGERLAINNTGDSDSNVKANQDALKIVAEPIYFSLFTPRQFNHAVMTITYHDHLSSTTPIIETGVLKDKISESYDLQPVQNDILDRLSGWSRLENPSGSDILQANHDYYSVGEFVRDLTNGNLKSCPGGKMAACVALYNYSLSPYYQLSKDQPLSPLTIDQPLRGAHQFYVYYVGPWYLDFDFSDLNLDKAADPITVEVLSGDKIIAWQSIDDKNTYSTSGQAEQRRLSLNGEGAAGVYQVNIKASDDIVINKIKSSSNRLSFINKIWPVAGFRNLVIFTDIANLQVQTSSPASRQSFKFGGRYFTLDKTYEPFDFSAGPGIKEIKLEKDDVVLAGNGVFSFSYGSLFNPNFLKIDRYFSADTGAKYIVADYQSPRLQDGWKIARAEFDLSDAYRENGKYTFLISVPGLKSSDGIDDYLEIKEIKIELAGKSIFQKIGEMFR